MNQTFDLSRFLSMIKLELVEKGRTQLLMAAVLVGLLLLTMLPIIFTNEYNNMLDGLHVLAMFMVVLLGGSLYTNQVFDQYASKEKGIAATMVPASRSEKFLSTLILNLLFIIPFVLLYLGLHFWTLEYANAHLLPGESKYVEFLNGDMMRYFLFFLLISQAAAFAGPLYFQKATFVKTTAVFFVTIIGLLILNYVVADNMMHIVAPNTISAIPFMDWQVGRPDIGQYFNVYRPETAVAFARVLPVIILLALWYITFLRLKEREI